MWVSGSMQTVNLQRSLSARLFKTGTDESQIELEISEIRKVCCESQAPMNRSFQNWAALTEECRKVLGIISIFGSILEASVLRFTCLLSFK